ncbi:MAG TPA: SDR family NAD(P)-dependent oxidoreductase [Dehalococcoidia bacterium]|nr:SDR family NAD(P)-dependent oxidoreductase [Dehalococcoidia bacterium]
MSKFNLKGRNTLITGASSGIGKELSRCFAAEGSNLVLGCHPSEKDIMEAWATELARKYAVNVSTSPIDLAGDKGPESLYESVKRSVGRIDVLVNNAGILHYGYFSEIPLRDHDSLVKVNAIAYLKLMRLFMTDMIKAGEGRILNVVSAAAFQPTVYHATYGASKAFIQSLSEAVNEELKGTGVKVFTFNPSYTKTPLLDRGGFPARIWWYKISGLSDPADMAHKAIKAFKKEKALYIPGFRNWFVHSILIRVMPRKIVNSLSRWVLRGVH